MDTIFSPNKTSARLLVDYATVHWGTETSGSNNELQNRYLLIYDLYIKARSYTLINKIAFWLAIIMGILVLIWPAMTVITNDFGFHKEFLKSAIVQTTVTGLAALLFAIYGHYKKRQMFMENLMRQLIYSDEPIPSLINKILKEIERIDSGFSFSASIMKKENNSSE